jgi:hypothetical protein
MMTLYKCDTCGHETHRRPPLFTKLHACAAQGCTGTAHPQEEVSPQGLKKKESASTQSQSKRQ